jgi:hypothetical protein
VETETGAGVTTRPAPWVAADLDELIAGADERSEVRTADAKSGAQFERVRIDGQPYFLKKLSADSDWIMRVTGNTSNWEFQVWKAGLYQQVPDVIEPAIVGMALEGSGATARLSILMTEHGDDLVPPGDDLLPLEQHLGFIDHMAAFHATFMGWRDTTGLQDLARRFRFFAPDVIAPELLADDVPGPIRVADQGWGLLPERAPRLDALVRSVHADPEALATAMRETPCTFVSGDWKLGNLGTDPQRRTVLLDWAYPGEAPPCWELMWYLALNRSRMPQSKEDTIAGFRAGLERHGVDTTGWWDRQLGLCTVGMMATMAWEKAVGDADELAWWESAALSGAAFLS